VSSYSQNTLRTRNTRKSRRVHSLPDIDASAWPQQKRYVVLYFEVPTSNRSTPFAELNLYVGQLTPRQKADPAVRHALGVQRALSTGNYHALFGMYINAPNMGAYIMDHFIDRERVKALIVMTKASVVCLPRLFDTEGLSIDINRSLFHLSGTSWRLIAQVQHASFSLPILLLSLSIRPVPMSRRCSTAGQRRSSSPRFSRKNIARSSSRVQYSKHGSRLVYILL
jgi:hypothetical protein